MAAGVLIFVFERVSCGRGEPILAEFAPVPNVPSVSVAPVSAAASAQDVRASGGQPSPADPKPETEVGGPTGPEPTRFGDWEKNGRCIDF
jgi:hypothetical protein